MEKLDWFQLKLRSLKMPKTEPVYSVESKPELCGMFNIDRDSRELGVQLSSRLNVMCAVGQSATVRLVSIVGGDPQDDVLLRLEDELLKSDMRGENGE